MASKQFNYKLDDELFDSILPNQINLKSFEVKKNMNPKIWQNGKLNIRVRKRLILIAKEFINFLKIDWAKPKDIIFVGSLAGYNWSKYSDIDLHIIYDFSEIDENIDFAKNYCDSKKSAWNSSHKNLNIFGYDIELYVQDINEVNKSNGVFSIYENRWKKIPICNNIKLDKVLIKELSAGLINRIDKLEDSVNRVDAPGQLNILKDKIENLYNSIIKGRKESLEADGEQGVGNIVFKVLRRTKHLEKLKKLKTLVYDTLNSIS